MQSSKVDFLSKYNTLVKQAIDASHDLPDNLCEFLLAEYELQAVILFKVNENNSFTIIGKSGEVKKNYIVNNTYECRTCKLLSNKLGNSAFNSQADCEIQVSEHVIYEGCIYIKINGKDDALCKIAKKTPFSNTDRDNLQTIGEAAGNILKLWFGNKGSIT